jgi:hypothetical protein
VASGFIMTGDDAAEPGVTAVEQILELRLLTAEDKGIGPVDLSGQDFRLE